MTKLALTLALLNLTSISVHADTLVGRIVDVNGIGIANGDIDIRDSGMDLILTGDSSDANGFFNLTIPPGDYDVQVEGPPGSLFIDVTLPDFIVSGVSDFGTIVLEQGMNLTGRAIDENGFPVARCDLDVTSFVTGRSVDLSGGRTDVFGNFNIFVPSSIALNFDTRQVFGPTLAPRQEILSLTVDTHIGDITLLPGFVVSGRIIRPNGNLVVGAELDFTDPLGNEALTYGDRTDVLGNFSTVVAADNWEVRFCPPAGTTLAPFEIDPLIVSGRTPLGTLTMPAGVLLFGTLTDEKGLRVHGADVDVIDAFTGTSMPLCGDGSSPIGNYEIRVPAGTYHVLFTKGELFGIRRDVVINSQTRVDEVMVSCPGAQSVVRNGNGTNPVILTSSGSPRIARRWNVELDCTGYQDSLVVVALAARGHPGMQTIVGEALIDFSSEILGVAARDHTGNVLSFTLPVPPNIALCGRTASGQGIILGAPGPHFTNALDVSVGP